MKEPQILSSLNLKFAPLCLSPNAQGRDFSSFRSFISVCARISRRGDETEPRDAETLPLKIRFPTLSAACGLELFRPHPKSRFFGAAGAVSAGTWEQFSVREKTPFIPIWKKTHLEIIAAVCSGRIYNIGVNFLPRNSEESKAKIKVNWWS